MEKKPSPVSGRRKVRAMPLRQRGHGERSRLRGGGLEGGQCREGGNDGGGKARAKALVTPPFYFQVLTFLRGRGGSAPEGACTIGRGAGARSGGAAPSEALKWQAGGGRPPSHKTPRSQCKSKVDLKKWVPALASRAHLFPSRCTPCCGSWEMAVTARQLGSEQRAAK